MRVENFDLKWAMRSGGRRFPHAPWWSEAGQVRSRVPRRVNIEIAYFDPGEYTHPLTQEPLPDLVVRFTQKIRQSSWTWRPMQSLSVDRYYATLADNSPHWSPVRPHGGWMVRHFEEIQYQYNGYDRAIWYPVSLSFIEVGRLCVYQNSQPWQSPRLSLNRNLCIGIVDNTVPESLSVNSEIVGFVTPRHPPSRISYQF